MEHELILIISSNRDTSQFSFRTRREEEITALAVLTTSNEVIKINWLYPKGLPAKLKISRLAEKIIALAIDSRRNNEIFNLSWQRG